MVDTLDSGVLVNSVDMVVADLFVFIGYFVLGETLDYLLLGGLLEASNKGATSNGTTLMPPKNGAECRWKEVEATVCNLDTTQGSVQYGDLFQVQLIYIHPVLN